MNKKEDKNIIITTLLSAVIIMIIQNFKIHGYDKYFIIPIIILLFTYFYILKNKIINKKGYIYLLPIILIIIGTVIFKTNISNMILNIIIIPILITNLFLTLTNNNYSINSHIIKWLYKIFPSNLFSNLKIVKDNIDINNNNKKKIVNIIKGILLSIPFIIVFMLLLTSADMYFNVFIEKIFRNINNIFNFNTIKNNILVFIIYFIILFSSIINIIKNKNTVDTTSAKRKIEGSIASTLLIMINLVFVLFLISEISKITTNFLEIPMEYTYSMYAREGFFQLLFVTFINFSIIMFFIYKTDSIKENKIIKNLILLLIVFTIILIFNSYYRMFLYMYEYGFTVLRNQVILFLFMELLIFLVLIKKIINNLKHKDAYIFASIMITIYTLNIYLCNINLVTYLNNIIGK